MAAVSVGFVRPRPPRRVRRVKRSLLEVVAQLLPVRACRDEVEVDCFFEGLQYV